MDALLDDPAAFAPFEPHFRQVLGRPSTPDRELPAADVPQVLVPAGLRGCARRSAIRSTGGGSAGSGWTARCRTRRR